MSRVCARAMVRENSGATVHPEKRAEAPCLTSSAKQRTVATRTGSGTHSLLASYALFKVLLSLFCHGQELSGHGGLMVFQKFCFDQQPSYLQQD